MDRLTEDRIEIPAYKPESLCWLGDTLVDFAGPWRSFHLDGTVKDHHRSLGFRFDATVVSPSGQYAAVYERLGTKAVLLSRGEIQRELNRSFSEADVFEYPIVLFALPDGREVVAHCPDAYGRIEIEDAETGERLTPPPTEKPIDLYHSRLAVTPDGRWLMSAGWVWHPADTLAVFNVDRFLTDATYHDGQGEDLDHCVRAEVGSAAFCGVNDRLLLASNPGSMALTLPTALADGELGLYPGAIGMYDLAQRRMAHVAPLEESAGMLMPIDDDHVLGFYKHPKLIHLPTGRVLRRWEDLATGEQTSSILPLDSPLPPLALDPVHRRFAVADAEKIIVVTLNLP